MGISRQESSIQPSLTAPKILQMQKTTNELINSNTAKGSLKNLLGKETLSQIESIGSAKNRDPVAPATQYEKFKNNASIKMKLQDTQNGTATTLQDKINGLNSNERPTMATFNKKRNSDRKLKVNKDVLDSVSNEMLITLKGFTKNSNMSKKSNMLKKTKSLPRIVQNVPDGSTFDERQGLNRTVTVDNLG